MKKADRVFGLICLALSFWLIIEGLRWDYTSGFTPGPGFEPIWLGIFLALLSLFLIYNSFRRSDGKEDYKKILPEKHSLYRLGLILVIFSGFALVAETFGFTSTVFLFVALILFVLEGYSIKKSLFYGISFSGSIFLIFRYWMNIELPPGFLGF